EPVEPRELGERVLHRRSSGLVEPSSERAVVAPPLGGGELRGVLLGERDRERLLGLDAGVSERARGRHELLGGRSRNREGSESSDDRDGRARTPGERFFIELRRIAKGRDELRDRLGPLERRRRQEELIERSLARRCRFLEQRVAEEEVELS